MEHQQLAIRSRIWIARTDFYTMLLQTKKTITWVFFAILLTCNACGSLVSRYSEVSSCPTPDEPYLHPELCQESIAEPAITKIIFDPPGGKVPLRVRFHGDASAGLQELDENLILHWDLDGDGTEDTTSLPGDSFYFDFETCETVQFQIWVDDELGKISQPLRKIIRLTCNLPPFISNFEASKDLGPPGTEINFFVEGYDVDPDDSKLRQGIAYMDWDMDGDGQFDFRTGSEPLLLPYQYTYSSVGIYRPHVRIYDGDNAFADSERLQIQILGTSSIKQIVHNPVRADGIVVRGDSVVTFTGSGITIRAFENGANIEKSQIEFGAIRNGVSAKYKNLFLTSNQDGGGMNIWNASAATNVTATEENPQLLRNCAGSFDYLGGKYGRSVEVHSFDVTNDTVTVAIVDERQNNAQATKPEAYLIDLSRAASISVTENSGSSCADGSNILGGVKALGVSPSASFLRAITAESGLLWSALGSDGISAYHLPSYWSSSFPLPAGVASHADPKAAHITSGYGSNFRAYGIGAQGRYYKSNTLENRSVEGDIIVFELHDFPDVASGVTIVADGWGLPATSYAAYANSSTVTIATWLWEGYGLATSTIEAKYHTLAMVIAADSDAASVKVYGHTPEYPLSLKLLKSIDSGSPPSSGSSGKIRLYDRWFFHLSNGNPNISSGLGLFVAPITSPNRYVRIPGLNSSVISDYYVQWPLLFVALGADGVKVFDLSAIDPWQEFSVSIFEFPARSYAVGGAPQRFVLDSDTDTLWAAEGRAGLHLYSINSSGLLSSRTRESLTAGVWDLSADTTNGRIYAAASTLALVYSTETTSLVHSILGYQDAQCIDYRVDSNKEQLLVCDVQQDGSTELDVRLQNTGPAIWDSPASTIEASIVRDVTLGPVDVDRPRIFGMNDVGISVFCAAEPNGACPGGDVSSLPSSGVRPTAYTYKSKESDLLIVGAEQAKITFWDFSGIPTLIGSALMCDQKEKWLPSSVCEASGGTNPFENVFDINDISVVPPYAFIATTRGVFALDLRAAPILRVGSFITGFNVDKIVARYIGGGKYIAYGSTGTTIRVMEFSQFEPAQDL